MSCDVTSTPSSRLSSITRSIDRANVDGSWEYGFLVFYLFLNLFFIIIFFFGKLGPSRVPSRIGATRTRREFLFRNSYPRYASVGVPASNTSRAVCDLVLHPIANRPRRHGRRYRLLPLFRFFSLLTFAFQHEL